MDKGFARFFEVGPRDGCKTRPRNTSGEENCAGRICSAVRVLIGSRWASLLSAPNGLAAVWLFPGEVAWRYPARRRGPYGGVLTRICAVLGCGCREAGEDRVFAAASEGFKPEEYQRQQSKKGFARFAPSREAGQWSIPVAGLCLFVVKCPFDGAVDPSKVAELQTACFPNGLLLR